MTANVTSYFSRVISGRHLLRCFLDEVESFAHPRHIQFLGVTQVCSNAAPQSAFVFKQIICFL